jgi:hypothetical protein
MKKIRREVISSEIQQLLLIGAAESRRDSLYRSCHGSPLKLASSLTE